MEEKRVLSTPMLCLVWFGASVSLAEILTGTFYAPLGFEMGMAAIVVGHIIGCVLFWLVSLVSARTEASAMEAARRSFGRFGSVFFSGANVVQLVGWTAIMIMSGAAAAALLAPALQLAGWAVVIGALIVAWIALGVRNMSRVQAVASVLLFALTAIAAVVVFGGDAVAQAGGAVASAGEAGEDATDVLSFGAAVELAVAMPLSWLPVVGDYTRFARRPLAGSLGATVGYFAGSCWMYAIGLGCALFAGSDDFAVVLAASGLGVAGILIVVFSTVTTTFLDAQSAGHSAEAIHPMLNARVVGILAAVVGTTLAIVAPVGDFEGFLYLIGSVFAPMAAIVIVDCFVLKRDCSASPVDWPNAILWVAGFVLYRVSLGWDLPCGNTLPVMCVIALAAIAVNAIRKRA